MTTKGEQRAYLESIIYVAGKIKSNLETMSDEGLSSIGITFDLKKIDEMLDTIYFLTAPETRDISG